MQLQLNEEEQEFLTPEEIAILAFTNNGELERVSHRDTLKDLSALHILTGKASYYMAVALTTALVRCDHIDEKLIYNAYQRDINENIDVIKMHYATISFSPDITEQNIFF